MKRADAQKAIDEAFAEGIKRLFDFLVENLEVETPEALKRFTNGIAKHDEAHTKASAAIDKIFPE